MAVPKKRTSKMKKRQRRSHHHMKRLHLTACPQCGSPTLPHRVCQKCGHYKQAVVVAMDEF